MGTENLAPVWVSEFGSNTRYGMPHYNYTFRFWEELDIDWTWWPLDCEKVPPNFDPDNPDGKLETYGIFDTGIRNWRAVVGWKLQDLISIQKPLETSLREVPPPCKFELRDNLAAAQQPTDFGLVLRTTHMGSFLWAIIILPITLVVVFSTWFL